jgi:outer membrane lipoprotein SlyB
LHLSPWRFSPSINGGALCLSPRHAATHKAKLAPKLKALIDPAEEKPEMKLSLLRSNHRCPMLKKSFSFVSVGALALALAGCASTRPASPSLTVLPGQGKSQVAFDRDSDLCESAAQRATGYESPGQAANDAGVSSAVVGTALGALAGAAIGSASGKAGAGAAIGAGTGLLAGSAVGASRAADAGGNVQARYDRVYAQCMSQRGHQVLAPQAPRETIVVYERPAPRPVYVYPRPYYEPNTYYRRW